MNSEPLILVNSPIVVGKGFLLPFDFGKITEIDVKRVFIISDLQGSARGGHAHKNSKQALQVINGNISCHITNLLGKKMEISYDSRFRDATHRTSELAGYRF